MNKTLIGLTTYNHYPFTYLCLKYLEKNTPELKDGTARLIVLDNNSTDETHERILIDFPWISEFIVEKRDCIPYQLNKFIEMLQEDEDFCMVPNDICVGPNWLKLLKEDTYKYDEVIMGSPYLNCDLQYDEVINQEWADNYFKIYPEIRKCNSAPELENYLNLLYNGDFDQFCLDFQERNKNEPPIDCAVTHLLLFKSKLFKIGYRFDDINYPNYYGSWEYENKARLNNMGYFSISSSRSYAHHFISIANQDSNIELSAKQKEIRKNNIKLFQRWKPIPGSQTFLNGPRPSRIPNWRTGYYKYELRNPEISPEEAASVPGIKFLTFEGITPGHDYFDQIQPGSIIRNLFGAVSVFWRDDKYLGINWGTKEDPLPGSIDKDTFIEDRYCIDYYWREEEDRYFGKGHQDSLLNG